MMPLQKEPTEQQPLFSAAIVPGTLQPLYFDMQSQPPPLMQQQHHQHLQMCLQQQQQIQQQQQWQQQPHCQEMSRYASNPLLYQPALPVQQSYIPMNLQEKDQIHCETEQQFFTYQIAEAEDAQQRQAQVQNEMQKQIFSYPKIEQHQLQQHQQQQLQKSQASAPPHPVFRSKALSGAYPLV
jgi:hypothetical protein